MKTISKYFIILSLLFIFSFGCKQEKKGLQISVKEGINVKDLNYHLANGLIELENNIGVEQKFNNDVYLRSFAFFETDKNQYDLIIELQDDITEDVVSKYTFAVEGFVKGDELEKLSDYAKSKKRTHEAWFGKPKLFKVNNRCYVILDIKTKLRNFDLIKFFLYDNKGYKGDIGERILFYDYKI
jgi:hypothetical protein